MQPDFLVHHPDDAVGVVVVEGVEAGRELVGRLLDGRDEFRVTALDAIPLGHKVALVDLAAGEVLLKYGHDVGRVVAPIRRGERVHVHNVKTARW